MRLLARFSGGVAMLLGLLLAFLALIFVRSETDTSITAGWIGLVLMASGAVPFIPWMHRRRWKWWAVVAFVYLVLLGAVLGPRLVEVLLHDGELTGLALLVLTALPGAFALRKGVGPLLAPSLRAANEDVAPEGSDLDPLSLQLQDAHAPTSAVKVAAGLLAWAGVLAAMSGVQLVGVGFRVSWMSYVPYAMLTCGGVLGWLALGVYKQRHARGVAAVVMAAVVSCAAGTWLVVSVSGGIVSMPAMLWPFAAAAAAVCTFLQLPRLKRATEIRERLEDAGFDLGL